MCNRIKLLAVLLLCCSFQIVVRAQQVPASVLLDNIREPADYVASYVSDKQVNSGDMSYRTADELFKRASEGVAAVEKALALGVPATRMIEVKFSDGTRQMPLAEIKTMCERMARVAGRVVYLGAADQLITNASVWPRYIADGTVDREAIQARTALSVSSECIKAIEEALAYGVPDSTVIRVIDRRMSLAEGREMCIYVHDVADKIVGRNTAAEEAAFEPFRKVLTGDKLKIYEEYLHILKVYGHAGKPLATPAQYRDSDVWYTVGINREVRAMWEIRGWRFRGMTKVADYFKNGIGDEPPSSAFP
jgi:hypothetical protein